MSSGLAQGNPIGRAIASAPIALLGVLMRLGRRIDGAAAVEFAVALPLLAGVLLPMFDIGMAAYQQMQVIDAAQAGADYALSHGWNTSAIQTAVTNATNLTGLSASPAPSQFCGCPSGTALTSATCGSTCANGQAVGTYVTVSAQRTFTPLVPYSGFGSSAVLKGTSTVRIQ
jgi:Flp pilus assembly protein TadG